MKQPSCLYRIFDFAKIFFYQHIAHTVMVFIQDFCKCFAEITVFYIIFA